MLTGEEEGSFFGGMPGAKVERTVGGTTLVEVPQPRRFYRLTAKAAGAGVRLVRALDSQWAEFLV